MSLLKKQNSFKYIKTPGIRIIYPTCPYRTQRRGE